MNEVTCLRCQMVHFEVNRADLENTHIYGAHTSTYLKCRGCGGSYKNFRDSRSSDSPLGCTLSPILARDE